MKQNRILEMSGAALFKFWDKLKDTRNDALVGIKDIGGLICFFVGLFINKKTFMVKKTNETIWIKIFGVYLFIGGISNDIFLPGVYVGKRHRKRSLSIAVSSKHGIKIGGVIDTKYTSPTTVVNQYRGMASDTVCVYFKTNRDLTNVYIKSGDHITIKQITTPLKTLRRFLFIKRIVVYQESFEVLVEKILYKTLDEKPVFVHAPYVIIYEKMTKEIRIFNVISFIIRKPISSKWEAAPGTDTNNLHKTNKEDWLLLGENKDLTFDLVDAINALMRIINSPG